MKGQVTCPECGYAFIVRFPKARKIEADVECLKCGYGWLYNGALRSRIHCPRCGSTRNNVNRKHSGKWTPEKM